MQIKFGFCRSAWAVALLLSGTAACGRSSLLPGPSTDGGYNPDMLTNSGVLSPSDVTGDYQGYAQFDTSMVRVDPAGRIVVGFTDGTNAVYNVLDTPGAGKSVAGWAYSDTDGVTWSRQPQLPVSQLLLNAQLDKIAGSPSLAASKDVILYTSSVSPKFGAVGDVAGVMIARSTDSRRLPGPLFDDAAPLTAVLNGFEGFTLPGPKVAISGDGTFALLIGPMFDGFDYMPIPNPTDTNSPLVIPPANFVDSFSPPASGAPDVQCIGSLTSAAPQVQLAAGKSTFYVAAHVVYHCPAGVEKDRLEVYRTTTSRLMSRLNGGTVTWDRIVSVEPPVLLYSESDYLAGQNISPNVPKRFDPSIITLTSLDSLPKIAVGYDDGTNCNFPGVASPGEFLILVYEQLSAGTAANEVNREQVVQWRLPQADTCDPHPGDLVSCTKQLNQIIKYDGPVDLISMKNGMTPAANRPGYWEVQPAVFAGQVPNGTVDPRVGMLWYAQPYKGMTVNMNGVTAQIQAETIVEAAVSGDCGKHYSRYKLNQGTGPGGGTDQGNQNAGDFFYPCQAFDGVAWGNFGNYISGLFRSANANDLGLVGTWVDSRQGCFSQLPPNVRHQHVFAGWNF